MVFFFRFHRLATSMCVAVVRQVLCTKPGQNNSMTIWNYANDFFSLRSSCRFRLKFTFFGCFHAEKVCGFSFWHTLRAHLLLLPPKNACDCSACTTKVNQTKRNKKKHKEIQISGTTKIHSKFSTRDVAEPVLNAKKKTEKRTRTIVVNSTVTKNFCFFFSRIFRLFVRHKSVNLHFISFHSLPTTCRYKYMS